MESWKYILKCWLLWCDWADTFIGQFQNASDILCKILLKQIFVCLSGVVITKFVMIYQCVDVYLPVSAMHEKPAGKDAMSVDRSHQELIEAKEQRPQRGRSNQQAEERNRSA